MKKKVKLAVELTLSTEMKKNRKFLDKIGYDIIHEYLSERMSVQRGDVDRANAEDGYVIEGFNVDIVKPPLRRGQLITINHKTYRIKESQLGYGCGICDFLKTDPQEYPCSECGENLNIPGDCYLREVRKRSNQ